MILPHTILHHISYHTILHHITSYHTTSHHISHHITPYITSHHTTPHHITQHHITSYYTTHTTTQYSACSLCSHQSLKPDLPSDIFFIMFITSKLKYKHPTSFLFTYPNYSIEYYTHLFTHSRDTSASFVTKGSSTSLLLNNSVCLLLQDVP